MLDMTRLSISTYNNAMSVDGLTYVTMLQFEKIEAHMYVRTYNSSETERNESITAS